MNKAVNQYDVTSARLADKKGELKSWVDKFLSKEDNHGLKDAILNTPNIIIKLTQFPLIKLNKIQGPQDLANRESLDVWEKRVSKLVDQVRKGYLPPPIIVTDFWWPMEIADGNHRHEALLREGFKKYWTIFIFKDKNSLSLISQSTKIKTVLVDVGGVLVRTTNVGGRLSWEKKLGLPKGQLTKELFKIQPGIKATLGQINGNKVWHAIRKKYQLNEKEIIQLNKDFNSGDRLNTKLSKYLHSLRPRIKVVIFSNAWNNVRYVYKNKFHLDKVADRMIISGEVGLKKPDKKFYLYALDSLNVKPLETILIDDDKKNIFTAQALGIKSILFTNTQGTINALTALLENN